MGERVATEKTLLEIKNSLALIEANVSKQFSQIASIKDLALIAASGNANKVLLLGDDVYLDWRDKENGNTVAKYSAPWTVRHFETVEVENGAEVNVVDIEWKYATPFGIPFDETEAFFESDSDLEAGTYHFTIANDAWNAAENGKVYQFTIPQKIPAGGQLRKNAAYNASWNGTTLSCYASAYSRTALWSVTLSLGSDGTNLGSTDGTGDLNHFHRLNLGYNRYSKSCIRQWLNSSAKRNTDGNANGWFIKQNKWDVIPAIALQKDGFLAGLDAEVVEQMVRTKIQTATNTVTDGGVTDATYDKVFLKSLEQWNVNPQISGVEGETWDHYKILFGDTKYAQGSTHEEAKVYALNAQTSPQTCWQRSANRGRAYCVWLVTTSGYINYNNANYDYRCAPACRLGKIG